MTNSTTINGVEFITYPCGCVNACDAAFLGAHYSHIKCDHHRSRQRETQELGEAYYRELGALNDGARENYEREFIDGFGVPVGPSPCGSQLAVEIGGGASPYVPLLRNAGWYYHGFESSQWAVDWTNRQYGEGTASQVTITNDTGITLPTDAGLVLCAHALEHVPNPMAVLSMIQRMLEPGGVFYLLIPDGRDDPLNPDHLWFFSPDALRRAIEAAGLTVDILELRQRVPHERFIYCKASKP